MTRIEKVVRKISDLREFYLKIAKEREKIKKKDRAFIRGDKSLSPSPDENSLEG